MLTANTIGGLFGIVVGLAAVIIVLVLVVRMRVAVRRKRVRLREIGAPHMAVIKQYAGRGPNFGVLVEIAAPGGSFGKQFNLDGLPPTFPPNFFADACATGRPIEIVYHHDIDTILIKNPATGSFE